MWGMSVFWLLIIVLWSSGSAPWRSSCSSDDLGRGPGIRSSGGRSHRHAQGNDADPAPHVPR